MQKTNLKLLLTLYNFCGILIIRKRKGENKMRYLLLVAELASFFELIIQTRDNKKRTLAEIFCTITVICILNFILTFY